MDKIAEVTINNMDAKTFDALGFTVPPGALDDHKRAILLPPSVFFKLRNYDSGSSRYYISAENLQVAETINDVKQTVAVKESDFLKTIKRPSFSSLFEYKTVFDVSDKATRDGGFIIDFIHALTVDIDHPESEYAATLLVYSKPILTADILFISEKNEIYKQRFTWREYDSDTISSGI